MSAFTAARGGVDPLTEPTPYHHRKLEQPFHIDHVFVSKEWRSAIELSVGTRTDWVAAKRSGHVPIIVDLLLPTGAEPAATYAAHSQWDA